MGNSFGIPPEIEDAIRARDKRCVYCRKRMTAYPHIRGAPTANAATIEHLAGLPLYPLRYEQTGFDTGSIAICCGSCNSSRGGFPITDWFETAYCLERGINAHTVAPVVQRFIRTRRYGQYRRLWLARPAKPVAQSRA